MQNRSFARGPLGFVLAILMLAAHGNALAGFVAYTDRPTFQADATTAGLTLTNENFATDPGNPFTITGPGGSATLLIDSGAYNGINQELFSGAITLLGTGLTGAVYGIGFNFSAPDFTGASLSLNSSADTTSSGAFGGFLGFLSDDFTAITVIDSLIAGTSSGFMDDVVIATQESVPPPEPMPVPGTLLLLGLGALGLPVLRRRAHA